MNIIIRLPKETKTVAPFDRRNPGQLVMAKDGVIVLGPFPCLGKGGRSKSAKSFDWRIKGNDTPTGEYIGRIEKWNPSQTYGPNDALRLIAVSGNALEAAKLGRSGLGLHGGRSQEILWSTDGCVRDFDRHQAQIIAAMRAAGITEIPVEIVEV
jgi:hypothetical protein